MKKVIFKGAGVALVTPMHEDGSVEVLKTFGYEDFKCRL